MQANYSPWYSVWGSLTRRAMAGLWAVAVVIFDFAVVMPFGSRFHPGLRGWSSLLLTDGTLGPIFAISLFQILVLIAVLAVPDLASAPPVRVALALGVLISAALTLATAVSSGGASLVILGLVVLTIGALRAVHAVAARFVLSAAMVIGGLLLSFIGVGSLLVGAGAAISGALTAMLLIETRQGRSSTGNYSDLRRLESTFN